MSTKHNRLELVVFLTLFTIFSANLPLKVFSAQKANGMLSLPSGSNLSDPDQPLTSVIIGPGASSFSLGKTNGNKMVSGPGGLHAVYASGNNVYYSTSSDGITWSSPQIIVSNADHPTIAVAGNVVGVAYRSALNDTVHYIYKKPNTPWSAPKAMFNGTEPSMVSYGSNMYLAWASGSAVLYYSFPAILTTNPSFSNFQTVNIYVLCGTTIVSHPSIAVSRKSLSNSQPLVRISYFRMFITANPCQVSSYFGVEVVEGPNTNGLNWNIVTGGISTMTSQSTTGGVSTSIAANAGNGDYYVGISYLLDGYETTELRYENAWDSTDQWRSVQILPHRSLIDVTAICPHFRIAVSDFTQGSNGLGPTWYRTGTWTGATALAPTWVEAIGVPVSPTARDPQAIFWTKHFGPINAGFNRSMQAMYATNGGVEAHYLDVNGPQGLPPCVTSLASTFTPFNYNYELRADFAVFRPSTGVWYFDLSSEGFRAVTFGTATDVITPGDYDGDGQYDVAVYRPSSGNWYILNSTDNSLTAIQFGTSGDVPKPADFDGDGRTDLAVYRPSNATWYIYSNVSGFQFGAAGDLPIAADFDGDFVSDVTVFRPSSGTWYIQQSTNGFAAVPFGLNGDKPVIGDYDGDGKTDVAVFRPSSSTWYIQRSTDGFTAGQFGSNGDIPVPADYDGDGKTDLAVFRPAQGSWYVLYSSNNSVVSLRFGDNSDIPVPSAYIP